MVARPKMTIIGSREQLCIHPEVSRKETNSEKVSHQHILESVCTIMSPLPQSSLWSQIILSVVYTTP